MEPVTEDEIRNVLKENKELTVLELVMRFKERLAIREHRDAFACILNKIAKLHKDAASQKYFLVLRDDKNTLLSSELTRLSMEPVTEDEIRNVLKENKELTVLELIMRFKERLAIREHRDVFACILNKIAKLHKDAASQKYFLVLRDDENTLLSSQLTRLSIS